MFVHITKKQVNLGSKSPFLEYKLIKFEKDRKYRDVLIIT